MRAMASAVSTPIQAENVKVLKEERISSSEMERTLSEFLKKRHIHDTISKEDWTRLRSLRDTLATDKEEGQRAWS